MFHIHILILIAILNFNFNFNSNARPPILPLQMFTLISSLEQPGLGLICANRLLNNEPWDQISKESAPALFPPFHPQTTTRTTYVVNMAKKNSFPDPLSQDIHRPLDLEKCSRGWETQEEHCYWIPKADIIGEVPKDLYGTLFRNGPGVNEVYGTRLKHRKYPKPGN